MSRRANCIAAMKELNMNHSDTRTSAASNNSQNPAPTPSTVKANPTEAQPAKTPKSVKAESTKTEQSKATKAAGPVTASRTPQTGARNNTASTPSGPTDLIREAEGAAPAQTAEAKEQFPKRIVHPVPHQSGPGPDTVEEVLKSPGGTTPKESPPHHQPDKKSSTDQDVPGVPSKAIAGGFKGLNNWLDSLPEPNLERLGDKIYAAPATFKKRWQQMRVERAKAAELREQERLVEVARAEAKAEAAKREDARVAHQAKLDSAARQAEEARLQASIPRPVEYPDPVESPAQPKPELHAGNLVPGPAHDWETVEHESSDQDVMISPSGTAVASTPAPRVDPDELAALVASAKAAIDQQQAAVEEPVYEAPYVLPETSPNPAAEPADLRRRILASGAAVAAAGVALANLETLSSGRVESLGSNYSLLSLAPSAHLIWPVVFVWAVLAAFYSWAPSQRSAVRQRAVGNRFALACAGNVLWMLSALNNWLFPAFGFAAASCWFLYTAVRELNLHTARTRRERMFTDAPVSLMTGFSLVMLASTLTNMLQSWGAGGAGLWFATILVPALGYGAATLSMTERGRIILALGFGWGMFWLLVPRVLGTNDSIWVAILAGMAGFVVLLATENRRYQIHHAEHRAARGKPTDFS
jgi:hypothetical protein